MKRRLFLGLPFALALPVRALAKGPSKPEAPLPIFPLTVSVAREANKPVETDAWIDAQIAEAERLLGQKGIHFRKAGSRPLPDRFARLETRKDRDALRDEMQKGVINVMVVASLRDVDDPRLYRMGVHWRPVAHPKDRYVIVATSALPSTLAHELGHYFGLGHTTITNNLMSYSRDGAEVTVSDTQGATMRSFARLSIQSKEVIP